MIPYRDINPTRHQPVLTWMLLLANLFAFLHESAMIEAGQVRFVEDWGFVPARFLADPAGEAITLLTSMFLHGGWMHLGSNLLFLWVFGDNVEDRLGRGRFLVFYVLSGVAAALAQLVADPSSSVPMVGASGAIAGVLGAYALLYPQARVRVIVPPLFFLPFELPAWLVIAEWFVLQVFNGLASLALPAASVGVAFFAHIGGFLAGLGLVSAMSPPEPPPPPRSPPPPTVFILRRLGPRRPPSAQ